MTVIFNDKSDVAIFFGLVIFTFTEILVGTVNINMYAKHKDWYRVIADQIIGMPSNILFTLVWLMVYILIVVGMYLFYRNESYPNNGGSYVIDTVTVLFVLNIMSVKFWPYVFFEARRTVGALLLMIFIVASGVTIDIIFAINSKWVEFGTFLAYVLWSIYALYLNYAWVYVEQYTLLPIKRMPLK